MDKQTTELLIKLSDKLGVSVEYLWSCLLKQAPISATIDCVIYAAMTTATIVYWRWWLKRDFKYTNESLEDIACIAGPVITFAFFLLFISTIENTIAGFFNPGYWALHELIHNK